MLWGGIVEKVVLPMVVSPLVGLHRSASWSMLAIMWIFRRGQPGQAQPGLPLAQTVSAAAMSVGHGMQDAAKTMGIVVLALYVGGYQDNTDAHPGVGLLDLGATVLAARHLRRWLADHPHARPQGHRPRPAGGLRRRDRRRRPCSSPRSCSALPISTTHTITSAIMGVGATKRLSAVRWGVAGNIVVAWVLTFPAAGAIAVVAYMIARPLF